MSNLESPEKIRAQLIEKARDDEDFRVRLLQSPKTEIEKELDIEIPDGMDIQVHEESAEVAHLVLPPHPKLTETELGAAAGGKQVYMYWCM